MSSKNLISKRRSLCGVTAAAAIAVVMSVQGSARATLYTDSSTFDTDPGWTGSNNTTGTSDFGYSAGTSNAGGNPGEIGGTIGRNSPIPFYAVSVGSLTDSDALSFSGQYIQESGASGSYIGFFNDSLSTGTADGTPNDFLGMLVGKVAGSAPHNVYVEANSVTGAQARTAEQTPSYDTVYDFSFSYDPGMQIASLTVNGATITASTSAFTEGNQAFDYFGMMGIPQAGNTATDVDYYDNLSWTSSIAQSVPEPASLGLLGLGAIWAGRRSRTKRRGA
jgi:hypothetical protein